MPVSGHKIGLRAGAMFLALLLIFTTLPTARAADKNSPVNILLIGVDSRDLDKPARSDTMLLLRIEPDSGHVKALSFMRDLYLPIPGCGKTRLNAAYYFGGEELLKTAIRNNFGIEVDHTVTVSFQLLAEVIDLMGGVTIPLKPEEVKPLNDLLSSYNVLSGLPWDQDLVSAPGDQLLTGAQALNYSRIRSIDSDFQRVGRQQTVIRAMLERLQDMDFLTLARIVYRCIGQVETDMGLRDINALLPLASRDDVTIQTARVPFDGMYQNDTIDGMQVLVPDLKRNKEAAWAFLGE